MTLCDTMRPFVVERRAPSRAGSPPAASARSSGSSPYYIREGGSSARWPASTRSSASPAVLLGFTNPDDHAHAPNESLVLANHEGGTRTVARYWAVLAEVGADILAGPGTAALEPA